MRKRSLSIAILLFAVAVLASGCSSTPQSSNASSPSAEKRPELPPVSVQSGAGHPAFKVVDQSPKGDEIIAVVVPKRTSDGDIVKLLWYFRSTVAAHRWNELGIYPPRILPSGVTTGMIAVYTGENEKCAQENDFEKYRDKEQPCGSGDHAAGFYQWGIPTDPTNDEAVLNKDGHEQRVFASADDHWKISDEPTSAKDGLTVTKASGRPIISYKLIATNEKLFVPDEGLRYAVISKRPTNEELIDLGVELHKKYPSSKFRIVDSTSGIKELDAFFDHPLTLKYPQAFASEHLFATVILWHQDEKWELIGGDAHPPSGEPIAVLE